MFCSFQKGSPFLNDINYLIGIRYQMGMSLRTETNKQFPNVTKCKTWNDVKRSHMAQDQNVVVSLDAIYGLLLIFVLGLCGAMVFLYLEHLAKAFKQKFRKV